MHKAIVFNPLSAIEFTNVLTGPEGRHVPEGNGGNAVCKERCRCGMMVFAGPMDPDLVFSLFFLSQRQARDSAESA